MITPRLRFSEEALRAVAQKAAKEGTGARALVWRLRSQPESGHGMSWEKTHIRKSWVLFSYSLQLHQLLQIWV